MSYTSKYTGQEIDNLLDKINNRSSKIVELGDFNYSSTQTSGAFQPNITATLNDSIENYDFIFIQITGSPATSVPNSITCATDDMIYVPSVVARGYSNPETKAYNLGCYWAEKYISCDLYFLSPTELKIGWAAVKTFWKFTAGKIYGIKLNGSEVDKKNDGNPVGTIISLMRKTAPEGYLICDGRELNIADYPALSTMFEEDFGSKNIYGGDGITTFAVPDLRNEFLRGYHGDSEEQLSGELGIHQDATEHVMVVTGTNRSINVDVEASNIANRPANVDKNACVGTTKEVYVTGTLTGSGWDGWSRYTGRPTNVAVLYCIKY